VGVGLPYRDFYYSIVFESLRHLNELSSPETISIGCLTGSAYHHYDITICIIEALSHFLSIDSNQVTHVTLVGYEECEVENAVARIESHPQAIHRDLRTNVTAARDSISHLELVDWDRHREAYVISD
jgi:hypothetical protein